MRKVLLVSPYFVPSNLAGVQRARLLGNALHQFGWEPVVVTVEPDYYEEAIDPASAHLVRRELQVERVRAFPARFLRPLGIGDISLRAFLQLKRRIAALIRSAKPDVVFVTVLPGYSGLLGSWAKKHFRVPFVLDYQDPWVPAQHGSSGSGKAHLAVIIARWLEPKVLPHVDALTAVSDDTLESLRTRGLIQRNVPIEIVPIGADRGDHEAAAQHGTSLIDRDGDAFQIAYVGTLTERMLPAFEAFVAAVAKARSTGSCAVTLHVIGSSGVPDGRDQHDLQTIASRAGLAEGLRVHPARVGYLDALRTMQSADLLVLIGSKDAHYTASKLFPYWLSGKPVLGVFHRSSTIVSLSRELGGVRLVLYGESAGAETTVIECAEIVRHALRGADVVPTRNEEAFSAYSAEGVAQRFADVFDKVVERCA